MTRSYVTNIICVAHNFQGFDGHFLISELLNRKFAINPVMNGTKIMKLTCKNVSFIDSLNFLPFPLSKFSDVFGFENHNKGYYPYFFNTKENFNYIGKYPTPKMYGYNSMKQKERQKFLEWYSSNCTKMFDNKNEMLKYCINDVTILRFGCLSFMKEFLEITAVNPFTESLTIASACMLVFRKNFLKAQTLAIMPKNKYLKGKQFSFASLKWLHFKGMNTTVGILSALNTGEVKLEKGGLFVDGFDPKTNTVYEFFGCFYHGCPDCFKFNSSDIIKGSKCDTLSQRHESTMKKMSAIRKNGYNLEYIWECDFKDFLKRNPAVDKQITEDLAYFTLPLTPRDAVYGGRTEVFRTYAKINAQNEIIRYLDFTSLYPYINKYAPYPIGHPTIFRNQTPPVSEILEMHGFTSCSILPPDNLFLPVLPYK
ncbi:uncharacterized protein LOC119653974 [Hermetia illucens]|uniref:uncharacterized protein LOC119653974 n=1 Tax=Hermetia illucens TaxID=343691 RepID=UPI0018CC03F7|nr:uncharacterized protein LOC119653974 [Hermetia illucens]